MHARPSKLAASYCTCRLKVCWHQMQECLYRVASGAAVSSREMGFSTNAHAIALYVASCNVPDLQEVNTKLL